jgi:hypothetical protein
MKLAARKHKYTAADALKHLAYVPDALEIERLIEQWRSYEREHRLGLLDGLVQCRSNEQITQMKFDVLKLHDLKGRSRNGHSGWTSRKLRRAAIRLLYLRFRFGGLSQPCANDMLEEHDVTKHIATRNGILAHTTGALIDGKLLKKRRASAESKRKK